MLSKFNIHKNGANIQIERKKHEIKRARKFKKNIKSLKLNDKFGEKFLKNK